MGSGSCWEVWVTLSRQNTLAIEIAAWGRSAPVDRLRGRRCASAKADDRPKALRDTLPVCRGEGIVTGRGIPRRYI